MYVCMYMSRYYNIVLSAAIRRTMSALTWICVLPSPMLIYRFQSIGPGVSQAQPCLPDLSYLAFPHPRSPASLRLMYAKIEAPVEERSDESGGMRGREASGERGRGYKKKRKKKKHGARHLWGLLFTKGVHDQNRSHHLERSEFRGQEETSEFA